MTLMETLERQHGFTKTDAAIANYILAHVDEACVMTIVQLADATYTSRSAVLRLCQKLGSRGFRTFRVELARELERRSLPADPVNPNEPFGKDSSTDQITDALAQLFHKAVDDTNGSIDARDVRHAAHLIEHARHVALFGIGDTMASLEVFAPLLVKCGIMCNRGYGGNDRYTMSSILDAHDVVVMASYSGINLYEFEKQLEGPLSRRCKTIVLTSDTSVRDRMMGADCLVLLPRGENHENRGAYYSQGCLRFALSCIFAQVVVDTWDANDEVRNRLIRMNQERTMHLGNDVGD